MNKLTLKVLALLGLCALSVQPTSAGIGNYIACAGIACLGLGLSVGWDLYQATKPTAQSEDNPTIKTEEEQIIYGATKTPEGKKAILQGLQKGIKNISFFRHPIARIRMEAIVALGFFVHSNQATMHKLNLQRLQKMAVLKKWLRKL